MSNFYVFWGKKIKFEIFFENIVASALKSCIINLRKKIDILKKYMFGIKLGFLGLQRFSNLKLQHKGLLLQDWVFRLGHEMELYSVLQLQMIYLILGIVSKGFLNHNF